MNPVKITYLMNTVTIVTEVMEEVTNTKVIRLLYDFLGHKVHCIIKKKYSDQYLINILLASPKTSMMTLKYLKFLQCLHKNYTAVHNLHNPDHNLPGLMIKSDSSETKHIN